MNMKPEIAVYYAENKQSLHASAVQKLLNGAHAEVRLINEDEDQLTWEVCPSLQAPITVRSELIIENCRIDAYVI